MTTSKVRVVVNGALASHSRITEVEAYTEGGVEGASGVQWLVSDQLGTPRMVIDQSGSLSGVKRHDYLPFGEEIGAGVGGRTTAQGYSQPDGTRQHFIGSEHDGETGLDFMQARYNSSIQGRFTSVDPLPSSGMLAIPQSLNRYAYVHNNPLRLIDPTGLIAQEPASKGSCGAATNVPCTADDQIVQIDTNLIIGIPLSASVVTSSAVIPMPALSTAAEVGAGVGAPEALMACGGLVICWGLYDVMAHPRQAPYRHRDGSLSSTAGTQALPLDVTSLHFPVFTLPAPPGVGPNIYIKTPGLPTEADGFTPKKKWDGKLVPSPNGGGYGVPDNRGNVWVPTGEGPTAHGGPHWDVQKPDGTHVNVYPGGKTR
ncbi:MAG: RHS repeat-associated core domain-containing protein [Pyrinomonadaceae bacterium]